MGKTNYDYTALLSDGTLVHEDNEDDLKKKIAGKTVEISYHRKEDDMKDEEEIKIDECKSKSHIQKLPPEVQKVINGCFSCN